MKERKTKVSKRILSALLAVIVVITSINIDLSSLGIKMVEEAEAADSTPIPIDINEQIRVKRQEEQRLEMQEKE